MTTTFQVKMQALDKLTSMLKRNLQQGDYILHTRCMGVLEEHRFTGWDGAWICGQPTSNTVTINGVRGWTNDIAPSSITHINRIPVDDYEALKGLTLKG